MTTIESPTLPAPPQAGPPRRRARAEHLVVGAGGLAALASLRTLGPGTGPGAAVVGQAGGLALVAVATGLALRAVRELRAGREAAPRPAAVFTPAERAAVFAGAVGLQLFVLYLAFLTTGHGAGPDDFRAAFVERFTTAGDNPHYLYLAEYGYTGEGPKANLVVFFPLYPALIWLLHHVTGSYVAAALLISWVCWGAACVSMLQLAARHLDRHRAATAALLLALFPFSFFAMGVFTESLFLLLSAQCLLRLERRHWTAAGVTGCLAALCRTQGVLLVLPALWLLARARPRRADGAWVLLIPAGYAGYLLLNRVVAGDATAFLHHQQAAPWFQKARWVTPNLAQHVEMAQQHPGLAPFIYVAQLVLFFAAVALLAYGLRAGAPLHLLLYGTAYLTLCYLSSWLISGPRYVFACLPLFLLAARPAHRAWQALVPVASGMLLLCYAVFYMQGQAMM